MAAISCLYFGSLPFYKDWINVRLRLCYCCSALCLTLIQSWGTLVVTGKDDNCSGFSNAKFAINHHVGVSTVVSQSHENQNAILVVRPNAKIIRFCRVTSSASRHNNTNAFTFSILLIMSRPTRID